MGRKQKNKKNMQGQASQSADETLQKVRSQQRVNKIMMGVASLMLVVSLGFMTYMAAQVDTTSKPPSPPKAPTKPSMGIQEEWDKLRQYDSEAIGWRNAALEVTRVSPNECIFHLNKMLQNRVLVTPTELMREGGSITITDSSISISPGHKRLLVMVPPESPIAKMWNLTDTTPAIYNQGMRTVFLLRTPLSKWTKVCILIHEAIHVLEDIQESMTHNRRPSSLSLIRSEYEAHKNTFYALNAFTNGRYEHACDQVAIAYQQKRPLNEEEAAKLNACFPPEWFNEPRDSIHAGLHYPLLGFQQIIKTRAPVHELQRLSAEHLEVCGYNLSPPGTNIHNSKQALALLIECDRMGQALVSEQNLGLPDREFARRYSEIAMLWERSIQLDPNYSSAWISLTHYYEDLFKRWVKANPGKPVRGCGEVFEPKILECTQNWFDLRKDDPKAYEYRIWALATFGDRNQARVIVEQVKERFSELLPPEHFEKLETYFR